MSVPDLNWYRRRAQIWKSSAKLWRQLFYFVVESYTEFIDDREKQIARLSEALADAQNCIAVQEKEIENLQGMLGGSTLQITKDGITLKRHGMTKLQAAYDSDQVEAIVLNDGCSYTSARATRNAEAQGSEPSPDQMQRKSTDDSKLPPF